MARLTHCLAQHALIGIATSPALQPSPAWGRWAKWTLDRGLRFYERMPVGATGLQDPVLFKLFTVPQGDPSARLAAARLQANAARAVAAGLGGMAASEAPPLYSYDPDIGRLAVTTPAYSTAVVAVNQHAFPYGGIELARLFDGEQNVAANIGGRAPAAFGILVRDPHGRRIFASQTPRGRTVAATPLRLTRAPIGTAATARTPRGRAFAGPFSDLRATGTTRTRRLRVTTSHRFSASAIETRWRVARLRGTARLRADALLPSWGRDARIVAVRRDGSRVSLRAQPVTLGSVARFEVISERSGYVAIPLSRPAGAVARLLAPSRQSSNPDPGPTIAVEIASGARWRNSAFAVRIVVTQGATGA